MCDIYAVALPYWESHPILRQQPRPSAQFAWNQAVLALRDDFMAPSMTTVHAGLLDLLGRPIYHVTGNITNAGRIVSLAYSQGLHRDPTSWPANTVEKSLRIRVWWAVLIHDHWYVSITLSHIRATGTNSFQGQLVAWYTAFYRARELRRAFTRTRGDSHSGWCSEVPDLNNFLSPPLFPNRHTWRYPTTRLLTQA